MTLTHPSLIQGGSAHLSSLLSTQHHHEEPLHHHLCSHHSWPGGHRGPGESFPAQPGSHGRDGRSQGCGHNPTLRTDDLPVVEAKVSGPGQASPELPTGSVLSCGRWRRQACAGNSKENRRREACLTSTRTESLDPAVLPDQLGMRGANADEHRACSSGIQGGTQGPQG